MDTISRRTFLKLTGAATVASLATSLTIDEVLAAGINSPLPSGTPILVIVTLYGGNDGLNTVVPYADSIYQSSRPGISLEASKVLALGDGLGLNSTMTGMKNLWDEKKLAIVRGVGYPQQNHSHFSSMSIWQSASPAQAIRSGWIGRWLDTQEHDPMRAISLGSVLPPLMAGEKRSGSVLPLGGLIIPSGSLGDSCRRLSRPYPSDSPLIASAALSMSDLLSVSNTVVPVLKQPAPPADSLPTSMGGNFGSQSSLSKQLDVVAKLIAAHSPTKVWSVSLGGFDTHADEIQGQSSLLGSVSDSINQFMSRISHTSHSNDVVVLVYSEFGRRVKANASLGTDHGTSGPVFIIGNKVKGGFYGDQPSLTSLVDGDLKTTTDFRDIYSPLLQKVLGVESARIIPNWNSQLNFI
jgi:uncharacterized protein (DUF1501 family)